MMDEEPKVLIDIIFNNQAFWGFVGVITGSILTIYKDYIFNKRSDKKEKIYSCILIINLFEDFIISCIVVANDNGTEEYDPQAGPFLRTYSPEPKLNLDDINIDWRCIPDQNLLYGIFKLARDIQYSKNHLTELSIYYSSNESAFMLSAWHREYAHHGITALKFVGELREIANLPVTTLTDERIKILHDKADSN